MTQFRTNQTGAGQQIQVVNVMDGTVDTGTTAIPRNDTIPLSK